VVQETSCGIIPFRRRDGRLEYLLLHSAMVRNPEAAWEFPKGSVEPGETEMETALRELREEAGIIAIDVLPDFRDQVHYQYRRGGKEIEKTVTFFVGEVYDWTGVPPHSPTREHVPDPEGGAWCLWLEEREARLRLFHPGMRQLLERVSFFLYAHHQKQQRGRPRRAPRP